MKYLLGIALSIMFYLPSYGQNSVRATIKKKTYITESMNYGSVKLLKVSKGNSVTLIGYKTLYWKVKVDSLDGYVPEYYVQATKKTEKLKKGFITKKKQEMSEKFKSTNSSKPTSRRCTGYTEDGDRCKRITKNKNGRCYQH